MMNKLTPKSIEELLDLVKTMIFNNGEKKEAPTKLENRINFIFYSMYIVIGLCLLVLFISFVFFSYSDPSKQLVGKWVIEGSVLLMLLVFILATVLMAYYLVKAYRIEDGIQKIYERGKDATVQDIEAFNKLLAYPKPYLLYVHTQLKEGKFFTPFSRTMLLGGDLRKLGLLPAIAAIAFSSNLLKPDGISTTVIWMLMVVFIFFGASFVITIKYERINQVIQLLQLAINLSEDEYALNQNIHKWRD